jgi:hypothetical protein
MSARAPRVYRSRGKRRSDKSQPLSVGANGDDEYFDDLETADGGAASEYAPELDGYQESDFETTAVRCCGACCMVFLGVVALSWIVHAIPVSTVSDIPAFARSMIWMSIAHHTDAWKISMGQVSPPPPAFGDGLGHFPDVFPPPPPTG